MRLNSAVSQVKQLLPDLEPDIQIVTEFGEYNRVMQFRHQHMPRYCPDIERFDLDPGDEDSLIFYTLNSGGNISSTARLAVDGERGLPDEAILRDYVSSTRQAGQHVVELGRFINESPSSSLLKSYYHVFYRAAKLLSVEQIAMVLRQCYISFHVNVVGAHCPCEDTGVTFGGEDHYGVVTWNLEQSKARFLRWIGEEK